MIVFISLRPHLNSNAAGKERKREKGRVRALNAKQRKDSRNVAADYIIHKDITLSLVRFQIRRRARKPLLFSPRGRIICIFTTPFSLRALSRTHTPRRSGCVDFSGNTKNNLHRQPCRPPPRLYSKCLKLNTQTHSPANKRARAPCVLCMCVRVSAPMLTAECANKI